MAIELQHYKTCPKCEATYPATTEHFYKSSDRDDGLSGHCKICKRAYMRIYRKKEQEAKKKPKPRVIKSITTKQIESIKQKFPEGKGIEIIENSQRIRGKVTKHFEHFMTIQAKYPTSVLYKDILIGEVRIKEG